MTNSQIPGFSLMTLLFIGIFPHQPDPILSGFTPEQSAIQIQLEKEFDTHLSSDRIGERILKMSNQPNHLGSPKAYQNAKYVDSLFRSWGYQSRIEEYHVLLPTPEERILEMEFPDHFTATLSEPALEEDATSGIREGSLPPYNAYSGEGDVTGELVYVNRGLPADYEELERRGVAVEGKIVIARYGGSWRGIKPKVAYERGAIGCIIYSDPGDDGYAAGQTYPEGPWRPETGVQRGSVMDLPVRPGDPLTPGVGATRDAVRLDREQSEVILKIPVIPISYADALPLLEALSGPVAPPHWRGSLPITYHMGPGESRVRLKLKFNWNIVPLYNVIAFLEGSEYPDQWVIRGNHMDGWVFGAADPLSGHSAMMEEAYALGQLVKDGWKPRRTVVFASWDGEEQGLLGSTEWVEDHAEELRKKAVVYINSDTNRRGFLSVGGSHSLQAFVNEVGRAVTDPQTNVSVLERSRAKSMVSGNRAAAQGGDLSIYPLGSGSDYTPFLQYLGISALNVGYGGEGGSGVYHSRYDSYDHLRRFGDPDFIYGVTLSQTTGRMILRFANAEIIPHRFTAMADNIYTYLNEIKSELQGMRENQKYDRKLHDFNAFVLAADPMLPYFPPTPQEEVPHLNFAPMENAVEALQNVSAKFDKWMNSNISSSTVWTDSDRAKINAVLQSIEQHFTDPNGLPRRPWYMHRIYAPGFYTGYGVKTLPGIREAVEEKLWEEAEKEIILTANVIEEYANTLSKLMDLFADR